MFETEINPTPAWWHHEFDKVTKLLSLDDDQFHLCTSSCQCPIVNVPLCTWETSTSSWTIFLVAGDESIMNYLWSVAHISPDPTNPLNGGTDRLWWKCYDSTLSSYLRYSWKFHTAWSSESMPANQNFYLHSTATLLIASYDGQTIHLCLTKTELLLKKCYKKTKAEFRAAEEETGKKTSNFDSSGMHL